MSISLMRDMISRLSIDASTVMEGASSRSATARLASARQAVSRFVPSGSLVDPSGARRWRKVSNVLGSCRAPAYRVITSPCTNGRVTGEKDLKKAKVNQIAVTARKESGTTCLLLNGEVGRP
jgi:hypothetical protein